MHSARYVFVSPSVGVVDWLSSTSGQEYCPALQCLWKEVTAHKGNCSVLEHLCLAAHISPSLLFRTLCPVLEVLLD